MATSPTPPTWGSQPPVPISHPAPAGTNVRRSANLLLLAVFLHGGTAPVVWLQVEVAIQKGGVIPEDIPLLHIVAAIAVVVHLVFAAIAGIGAFLLWKEGPNVASVGTGLLVMGIIAVIFSFAVLGGFLGVAGGAVTAYAGNKARKRPPQMWATPPGSWIPSQPPTQPPPGP